MKYSIAWPYALATIVLAHEARATERYALVVGVNQGRSQDTELQYAEDDAERIAGVLTTVGGFHPENVVLLKSASASDFERAIATTLKRIEGAPGDTLFFVYYSGHADGEALNMRGTRFRLDDLRELIVGSTANARVLVLDACHAGVLTRVKGGSPTTEFSLDLAPDRVDAEGFAIVASSAAGEEAQESDELRASFFTHYFASALVGAGDRDGDSRVTLAEAFSFASDRTLRATVQTLVGPQHATYKVELKGRDDLVLSDLRLDQLKTAGMLQLSSPGHYVIATAARAVAELDVAGKEAKSIALGSGRYTITKRAEDHLLVGDLEITAGTSSELREEEMRRVEYARVVRKGGTGLSASGSAFVISGVRSPLVDTGVAWSSAIGVRMDLSEVSLELRLAGALSSYENERISGNTREVALSAAALRAFDTGPVTLNIGLELGGSFITQNHDASRTANALIAGPLAAAELPLGRFLLRAETALPTYVFKSREEQSVSAEVTFRAAIGLGFYL